MAAATHEYRFTSDWFTHNIPTWERNLAGLLVKDGASILEIGSYQGRSSVWLLEHMRPDMRLTCIDTFQGSVEHSAEQRTNLLETFLHNIAPFKDRVTVLVGKSHEQLKSLHGSYDMVYIDGDHSARAVMQDAVLAFPMLKVGGYLVFDDYMWGANDDTSPATEKPKMAIDAFAAIFEPQVRVVSAGWQVCFQRIA